MRHLKLFESFNEGNKILGTYTQDQFDEFCEDVKKWSDENGRYVLWNLYVRPDSVQKEHARATWERYIRDGVFIVIGTKGGLMGVILNKEGKLTHAYNDGNRTIDTSKFDPEFETI
jgi:hypothetical protein